MNSSLPSDQKCQVLLDFERWCCKPAKFLGRFRAHDQDIPMCGTHANQAKRKDFGAARPIK